MKIGMYNFQWAGGEFEVEFREKNIFWCKRFANEASWTEVQPGVVGVNWGKYGNYQLTAQPDGSFAGGVLTTDASGAPVVNTNDWRKATFVRAFTPAEELLSGSAWMLHYENGVPFRVEFHADGHFHSPAYPGHHLWKLNGNQVAIEWGKYGSYDLTLEVAADRRQSTASGSLRGHPASWRRLTYEEALPAYVFKENSCGHSH
ncbi:hypothetical protein EMIHUDRAFT_439283 [Emiliania huxleyi CCMP1516]|uniref:Uncharacterized protein n=2 Tax=Emiliania huxleyi TaxID=2903 RepID=A0A0D3HYI8_EMIH1|nr:hypothetical protein EMIHUDRAFT_439283 [Emiliania huxleyi CCMP1516]EOD04073.1 hypothetical protein EMIHUDRAFT_439283 [Emiliania huxleyi CCMP1516]|mmetsp:Transcript_14957/g.48035  ORF Transcript_14957/g.48035 Transcript_14957/m.48035 type:complete len:203 (+) Transcript_14957:1871-2479(+)|eukprot:XP_005756502.1 hypothetical protein EMIHUDRAFT_439283 [Emiliania huxleyi CCMP1516]